MAYTSSSSSVTTETGGCRYLSLFFFRGGEAPTPPKGGRRPSRVSESVWLRNETCNDKKKPAVLLTRALFLPLGFA